VGDLGPASRGPLCDCSSSFRAFLKAEDGFQFCPHAYHNKLKAENKFLNQESTTLGLCTFAAAFVCRHVQTFSANHLSISCCFRRAPRASQILLITHELEAPQASTDYFARVFYPMIPLWVFGRSARSVPRCEVKDALYDGWRDRANCLSCKASANTVSEVGVSL